MLILALLPVLLSNSLNVRRDISIYYSRIGIILLTICIYICYNNLYITYLESGVGLFGGLFNISPISIIFGIFIYLLSLIILGLTGFYSRKNSKIGQRDYNSKIYGKFHRIFNEKVSRGLSINKQGEQYSIIEYTTIILFIITGSILIISSSDLISLYISIELQSYGIYILCTIYRNSESSTASGLTYFLLGGLSSCFILLGIGLIYANSGTTYLDSFYIITNISNIVSEELNNTISWDISSYIPYCLLLITIGFLFKISAAPFHFWSPDVYDGIPTIVTTFVAIIPKVSILVFLLYLVHYTNNIYSIYEYSWTSSLLISSLLSLILGTVLGLTQNRIKRLLAYSTISHLGFILLGLSINSVESIQSFIFYLIQYSLSNLNAFFILISIGYTLFFFVNKDNNYNFLEKFNSPIQLISQLKNYFLVNPILALSFAITLFSFAGVPPFIGFFAKFMVLSAALQKGYVFLALVGIITSVISAVYYLNVVKTMFFFEKLNKHSFNINDFYKSLKEDRKSLTNDYIISISSILSITISILTLMIVLFIFSPNQIINMSNILSILLFTLN